MKVSMSQTATATFEVSEVQLRALLRLSEYGPAEITKRLSGLSGDFGDGVGTTGQAGKYAKPLCEFFDHIRATAPEWLARVDAARKAFEARP